MFLSFPKNESPYHNPVFQFFGFKDIVGTNLYARSLCLAAAMVNYGQDNASSLSL